MCHCSCNGGKSFDAENECANCSGIHYRSPPRSNMSHRCVLAFLSFIMGCHNLPKDVECKLKKILGQSELEFLSS